MTWTSAASVSYLAWAMPSPQPASSDNGIDFELQFRNTYSMIFSESRPLLFESSLSEGAP